MMKCRLRAALAVVTAAVVLSSAAVAQFNLSRGIKAVTDVAKAVTLSDADMAQYVKEYIDWNDANNTVADADDPYAKRLANLTEGLTSADGIPLNFKVYMVKDVNAFACPDGSVRVYSALMDAMSDEELLGVIGHEIGHVAKRHSKGAMKDALLRSALKNAAASASSKAAALTDSQLMAVGDALASAKFSRKNEDEADDYGYEFLEAHAINPRAMAQAFYKLKELQEATQSTTESSLTSSLTSRVNQLFASHPDIDARIKRMEKRVQKDGY